MKVSFTIYADLESLLIKMSNCHNNPEKSSTIKINKHARSQSYFKVPKDVRLNSIYVSIMKIANKRQLQQIPSNHPSDVDLKEFIKTYKKCTA